jgi:hypothetical protein
VDRRLALVHFTRPGLLFSANAPQAHSLSHRLNYTPPRANFDPLIELDRFALRARSGFNAEGDETMTRGSTMARRKTGLTIDKTRGLFYLLAKFLGDFQSARKGRVGKRIARRAAGRATGKGLGKLFH